LSSASLCGATVVPATPPSNTPIITLSPLCVDTRTAGSHAVQVGTSSFNTFQWPCLYH